MTRFRMKNLRRLGNRISVQMPLDEGGYLGRECPEEDCERYFKIVPGTGLDGEDLPCHCAYCGYTAPHDHFRTQQQLSYARSVVKRKVVDAYRKDLKGLEFDYMPKGDFGIGISMKLKPGRRVPVHRYREHELETEVDCNNCTLRYAVFGVFAFCPDCRQHNSLQILEKNLDLVRRMVALADEAAPEIAEKLLENALEDCVSAFDGFGRELCRVYAGKASNEDVATRLSFQNLPNVREKIQEHFGFDLAAFVPQQTWQEVVILFQKRHLVAHKMGVVDDEYVRRTGADAVVGRKVAITSVEVDRLADSIGSISHGFFGSFGGGDL